MQMKFRPKQISKESKKCIIRGVKELITMYEDISKGHIVRKWVCLCECQRHLLKFNRACDFCPADKTETICQGPGGGWHPIQELTILFGWYCTDQTQEIWLDKEFRAELAELIYDIDWDDKPTYKILRGKARYWTYERIIASADRKAKAWKKWLVEFKKIKP